MASATEQIKGVLWDHTSALPHDLRDQGYHTYAVVLVVLTTQELPNAATDSNAFHAALHPEGTPVTEALASPVAYEAPHRLGQAGEVLHPLSRLDPRTAPVRKKRSR